MDADQWTVNFSAIRPAHVISERGDDRSNHAKLSPLKQWDCPLK